MLITAITISAVVLVAFCVAFFVVCGCILLLDTVRIIEMRSGARVQTSKVFFGTILAGFAAGALVLISPEAIKDALQREQVAKERAAVANSQTEAVINALEEVEPSEARSVVFLHIYKQSRQDDVKQIEAKLDAAGMLTPGIDSLDIKVTDDQVRYFHKSAASSAEGIGDLVGIDTIRFVDGYQASVGAEHLEVWLKP